MANWIPIPYSGEQVSGICFDCGREPKQGETYGADVPHWHYMNVCPTCWETMVDIEEEG